ncbi:hypothetical protein [Pseudoxanthomonas dokdonensis]|nr:hypothetical protein [Pseudoxanthomonas dokdonensis]
MDYPPSLKLAALWLSRQPDGGLERVVDGLQIDELQLARWRATLARPR